MIIGLLLDILYGILQLIIWAFPNYEGLNSNIETALNTMTDYIKTADTFFPLTTLITITGIVITIEVSIMGFKLVIFIYNKVRGSG